jgi:hypothetical protein
MRASALVLALAALGPGLGLAGCGEDETYAYVNVTVTIDDQTITRERLAVVQSCDFDVRGVERADEKELRCALGATPYDLGTFRWAAAADRGILQFFVRIYDSNRTCMGEGVTPELFLSPGAHLMTEARVVAVPCTE